MNIDTYLDRYDRRLFTRPEGRIALTRNDPLLFAWLYLPHHLTSASGSQSLSAFHLELIEYAKSWTRPVTSPREYRDCFIAPRSAGKSTWLFLLLPMWAAAHGHIRFVAAFSDSASQAEGHLASFKYELDNNERLSRDYPELCAPMMGNNIKRHIAQSSDRIIQANGFVFAAKGIDAKTLGMKERNHRPDLILMDDIEPPESTYSELEASRRLATVLNAAFPLNIYARVAIVGTTTMPGSIIDQIRTVGEVQRERAIEAGGIAESGKELPEYKSGPKEIVSERAISTPFKNTSLPNSSDDVELYESLPPEVRWVVDAKIKVHYFPAIITREDGSEESLWPEFWSMDFLNSIRHTRDFHMNYMNKPVSLNADFWTDDDISIRTSEAYGNTLLCVDPAVTTKKASDYTGLSVLSRGDDGKVYVRYAEQHKISPGPELKAKVEELCKAYGAKVVLVESNMGGDVWFSILNGVPAKVLCRRVTDKKELRAAKALDLYRKGHVFHTGHFDTLQTQMYAFPKVRHDDVVDAVVSGVLYFLGSGGGKPAVKSQSYI